MHTKGEGGNAGIKLDLPKILFSKNLLIKMQSTQKGAPSRIFFTISNPIFLENIPYPGYLTLVQPWKTHFQLKLKGVKGVIDCCSEKFTHTSSLYRHFFLSFFLCMYVHFFVSTFVLSFFVILCLFVFEKVALKDDAE